MSSLTIQGPAVETIMILQTENYKHGKGQEGKKPVISERNGEYSVMQTTMPSLRKRTMEKIV